MILFQSPPAPRGRGLIALSFLALAAAGPVHDRVQALKPEEGQLALDVRLVRQIHGMACGAAVMESVLRYWGMKEASQRDILKKLPPKAENGEYSLTELKKIAARHSLKAFVVAAPESFIEKQIRKGRPVIVPVTLEYGKDQMASLGIGEEDYRKISEKHDLRYNHYLALIGLGEGYFIALDPAKGIYKLEKEKLKEQRAPHKDAALLLGL